MITLDELIGKLESEIGWMELDPGYSVITLKNLRDIADGMKEIMEERS